MYAMTGELSVDAVCVVSERNAWIYDTDMGYRIMEASETPLYQIMGGGNLWKVEPRYSKDIYFHYQRVGDVLTQAVGFPGHRIVAVKINYQNLCQAYQVFDSWSQVYIMDPDGNLLYDSKQLDVGKPADTYPFAPLLTEERGRIQFLWEGNDFTGIYLKSGELGWTYVLLREGGDILKPLGVLLQAFIFSLAALLMILLFASLASRYLYSPIDRLYHTFRPDADETEDTDEMKAIQSSVVQMLGDNHRLSEEVKGQHERIRELLLYQLFTGHVSSQDDYEQLEQYGIQLPWEEKTLAAIRLPIYGEERETCFLKINAMVKKRLPSNSLCAPVIINNLVFILLGTSGDDFQDWVEEQTDMIYKTVSEMLHLDIQLAYSSVFQRISEISQALTEIYKAFGEQSHRLKGVFSAEGESHQKLRYPSRRAESVIQFLKAGELEEVSGELRDFLNTVYQTGMDLRSQQLCITWLIGDVLQLAPDYAGPIVNQAVTAGEGDDLINAISKMGTVEQRHQWIMETIVQPVNEIIHNDDANKRFLVNRMLHFIHENSRDGGDIEACAVFLNYNSAYLRKIFKDQIGISYRQYTSNYYMEQAKALLTAGELSVGEIAERFGYSNAQNFIRFFKKEYGMTPGQYRPGNPWMEPETAQKIAELIQMNFPVWFEGMVPASVPGWREYQ